MYRLMDFRSPEFSFQLGGRDDSAHRFTVIIGANGSGKSRLLSQLAHEAIEPRGSFVEERGTSRPLILGVSNLVIDSFPKPRAWNDSYRYLGLRQANNTVSTGSLESSFGPFIVELMAVWASDINVDIYPVLRQVGVNEYLVIVAKQRLKDPNGNVVDLESALSRFGTKLPSQASTALHEELKDLSGWIYDRQDLGDARELGQRISRLSLYFDLPPAIILAALRLAYGVRFEVQFDGRKSSVENTLSAGQAMLLSMVLRIMAAIRPGSLVLIDEPETGTHPDWQSSFIPLLKKVLPPIADSHFFIATHSPYLVSDASDVLIASGNRQLEEISADVRGMSLESILYRVFETRVVGNAEVESDLSRVLSWMSSSLPGTPLPADLLEAVGRLDSVATSRTPTVNRILDELRALSVGDRS